MKKLLLLSLLFAAVSSFAAFQYNPKANHSGTFTFTSDSSMTIYVREGSSFQGAGFFDLLTGELVQGTPMADGGLFLGEFKAGDTIGVWASNGNGAYTSIENWGGGEFIGINYNENTGYYVLSWNTPDGTGSFEFSLSDQRPSGQPLPGVVATLLFGGAGAALLNRKRKR